MVTPRSTQSSVTYLFREEHPAYQQGDLCYLPVAPAAAAHEPAWMTLHFVVHQCLTLFVEDPPRAFVWFVVGATTVVDPKVWRLDGVAAMDETTFVVTLTLHVQEVLALVRKRNAPFRICTSIDVPTTGDTHTWWSAPAVLLEQPSAHDEL